MKRIAVLTGGGDAPGLNAVIRAVVKTAVLEYQYEVFGIKDGYTGLVEPGGVIPLDLQAVRGILPRGGTILGAANRGEPFVRLVKRGGKEVPEDIFQTVIDRVAELHLDALVIVGGDGTLASAKRLKDRGVPVVGVPKTIDNDINGTEVTFGFDTALTTATEAIDKLHTTAEAHHRVMVLELMGRNAGFIALHAGIAGGADVILIPEIPFHFASVCAKVQERIDRGSPFSIIAVSEGARPVGGEQVFAISGTKHYAARLGGIGLQVADHVGESCGVETRLTVLGHLQRGGGPTPFDRFLATRYGSAAVRLIQAGKTGRMVALQYGKIVDIPLEEALSVQKQVDVTGDAVLTARAMGISLGE